MSKSTIGTGKTSNGAVVHPRHRPLSGAVAPPSLASLKYVHNTLQDRLVPEAERQSRDFEDLTENVLRRLKQELARAESSTTSAPPSSHPLPGSKKRRRAPFHPTQLPARARELLVRWFLRFIHLNDTLLHARTGILRHTYQHAAATAALRDERRPPGLARYCDLDDRLCNYKHSSGAYAELCWDNATSLARLLQGPSSSSSLGRKGRAALEGLESSLTVLDSRLQELSSKAALHIDRVKAVLPGPMQMDRTPGSESLECLLPQRPCVSVEDCHCPPQGPPHANATPEQENQAWSAGKLYNLGYDEAISDIDDDTPTHTQAQTTEGGKGGEEEGEAMIVDTPVEEGERGKEEGEGEKGRGPPMAMAGTAVGGNGEGVVVLVSYQQQVVRVAMGGRSGVVSAGELLWAIALQIVRDRDRDHSGEGLEWPWLLHVKEQQQGPTSTSTSTSSGEAATYPPGSMLDLRSMARRQQRGYKATTTTIQGPPGYAIAMPTQQGAGAGSPDVVRLTLAWDKKRTIRPLPRPMLHYIRQCDKAGVPPLRALALSLLLPSPLPSATAPLITSCPSPSGPLLSALCDLATEHEHEAASTPNALPCPSLLSSLSLSLVQHPSHPPLPLPPSLTSLRLSSSGLRCLSPLLSHPLPLLTHLDLSHNPLLLLQPPPFQALLTAIPSLKSLCLRGVWVSVPSLLELLPPGPPHDPNTITQAQQHALTDLAQALTHQQQAQNQGSSTACGLRRLSLCHNVLPSSHCWARLLSSLPPSLTTLTLRHISPPPPPLPPLLLQTLTHLTLSPLPSHTIDSEGVAVLSPCVLHLLHQGPSSSPCVSPMTPTPPSASATSALRCLDLSCLRPRLAPHAATQLFASLSAATCLPSLEHLSLATSLDLPTPSTAETPLRTLAQALAQNPHLSRLETLSLRGCRLQLESLCALLSCVGGATLCSPLLHLDVSDNHHTPTTTAMGPRDDDATLMQLGLGLQAFLHHRPGRRVEASGNGLAQSLHVLMQQGEGQAGMQRVEGGEGEGEGDGRDCLVLVGRRAEGQH